MSPQVKGAVAIIALGLSILGCTIGNTMPTTTLTPTSESSPATALLLPPPTDTVIPISTATVQAIATDSPPPTDSTSPTITPTYASYATSNIQTRGAMTLRSGLNRIFYPIVGSTAEDLDSQMRVQGPADSLGNHWFALTEPYFDWEMDCACTEGQCTTEDVIIKVWADLTLPEWETAPDSDSELSEQWRRFEGALTRHEQGHYDLALQCGWSLGEAFSSLPAEATCQHINQAINTVGATVFAGCREAQRDYENSTGQGQTEGVIWPP